MAVTAFPRLTTWRIIDKPLCLRPAEVGAAMDRVALIYGTRPEAVKIAPLIKAVEADDLLDPYVLISAQHRSMLDQVNDLFAIDPHIDLDVIQPRQSLEGLTSRILTRLCDVLTEARPSLLVVQGDTTTSFTAALAGHYAKIPVAHLEAGLRTHDRNSPFPEEINRRLITQIASLHLAPTRQNRDNLLAEGVVPNEVVVTGNTVIDALQWTTQQPCKHSDPAVAAAVASGRPLVLVTAHRRESWGEPMAQIGRAVASIARGRPELTIILPLHRNPIVREVLEPTLTGIANVVLTEPLDYVEFAHLMKSSHLVLTDSGGVQEEAPSLGKPVLVMRENTERPEAVHAGTARLVGTDQHSIEREVLHLLNDGAAYEDMARAVNPYGDGRAADRAAQAIAHFLGRAPRPVDFDPIARGWV